MNNAQPGVTLTSSDPNDDTAEGLEGYSWDPAYQPLINGTTIFQITLVTGNTQQYRPKADPGSSQIRSANR